MLVEALERATAGRALVVFTLPLVVTPGQLVEHVRADPHRLVLACLLQLAQPQQVVHHRRQPEAGAGPLAPLVQHQLGRHVGRHRLRQVGRRRRHRRQRTQRRLVDQVAKVQPVRPRVEAVAEGAEAGVLGFACRLARARGFGGCLGGRFGLGLGFGGRLDGGGLAFGRLGLRGLGSGTLAHGHPFAQTLPACADPGAMGDLYAAWGRGESPFQGMRKQRLARVSEAFVKG